MYSLVLAFLCWCVHVCQYCVNSVTHARIHGQVQREQEMDTAIDRQQREQRERYGD